MGSKQKTGVSPSPSYSATSANTNDADGFMDTELEKQIVDPGLIQAFYHVSLKNI